MRRASTCCKTTRFDNGWIAFRGTSQAVDEMGIRFRCHHCEHRLNIKTELAGRRGICPKCAGRFRIPLADQEHSSSLEINDASLSTSTDHSANRTRADIHQRIDASEQIRLYLVKPPSGGVYGPADLATIETWISERRITADTVLAQVGSSKWQAAGEYFPHAFA